jgi:hypothetical protein
MAYRHTTEFTVKIDCGNAAFGFDPTDEDDEPEPDEEARAGEVARILRKIAYALEQGGADDGGCTDTNGNSVGTYGFRSVAHPGGGNREETRA